MYADQGYFTRANKSKFTGEAGFAVVDASPGLDQEAADIYVRGVGEAVAFDPKEADAWMYAVLPSRIDGRISVTRAFPTSDGRRACHFSHTIILSEGDAKRAALTEAAKAPLACITGFHNAYVGEPAGLGQAEVEIDGRFKPANTSLVDTLFGEADIMRLLGLIAAMNDNRDIRPNFMRFVFVVYDLPQDKFEKAAFSLLSLLYANLPYAVTSRLGAVIKTDAAWRKAESYPSNYRSAYIGDFGDALEYIPGGELYIINKPLAAAPTNAAVVNVGAGGVTVARGIEQNRGYDAFIAAIAGGMAKKSGSASAISEFYRFVTDVIGDELSFGDICNFYWFTQTLKNPEEVLAGDWKRLSRAVRILGVSVNRSFSAADEQTRKAAKDFLSQVLDKDSGEPPEESLCVALLETGSKLLGGDPQYMFIENYYKFLARYNAVGLKNKKLLAALRKMPDALERIGELDGGEGNGRFRGFRNKLIESGAFEDLALAVRFFDNYGELTKEERGACLRTVHGLYGEDDGAAKNVADIARNGSGGAARAAMEICGLKEYNNAPYAVCADYISPDPAGARRLMAKYPVVDLWHIKFSMWLCADMGEETAAQSVAMLQKSLAVYVKNSAAPQFETIEAFRRDLALNKIQGDISKAPWHHALIKYMAIKPEDGAEAANGREIDWGRLLSDTVTDNGVRAFFKTALNIGQYIDINSGVMERAYAALKRAFSSRLGIPGKSEAFTESFISLFKSVAANPGSLEGTPWHALIFGLYGFAARKMMTSRAGISLQKNYATLFCESCSGLTPYSHVTAGKKTKCCCCGKTLDADEDDMESLVSVINIDCETAFKLLKDDKNKKAKGGASKFEAVKSNGCEVRVTIGGVSQAAEKFFEEIKSRYRRSCFVMAVMPDSNEAKDYVYDKLRVFRHSLVSVVRQERAAYVGVIHFHVDRTDYATMSAALILEAPDDRCADLVNDCAHAMARYVALKKIEETRRYIIEETRGAGADDFDGGAMGGGRGEPADASKKAKKKPENSGGFKLPFSFGGKQDGKSDRKSDRQ